MSVISSMGFFAKNLNSTTHMSSAISKGASSNGHSSKGSKSNKTRKRSNSRHDKRRKAERNILTEHNQQSKSRSSSHDLNAEKIDHLTAKVTDYRRKTCRGSTRESRSAIPRSIPVAIIGSPMAVKPTTPKRSRSADPATTRHKEQNKTKTQAENLKKNISFKRRSKSAEPARTPVHKSGESKSTIEQQYRKQFQSLNTNSKNSLLGKYHTSLQLEKDMVHLADGINLDATTRALLAAYDARSLEDFYLMSDNDFSMLVFRAKVSKSNLPPLQVRKVQMLRRWLRDVVEENINDNDFGHSRRRSRDFRIIPRDWKDQYKNDLPHLKLQLRQQGDSIFERLKIFGDVFACGVTGIY